MTRLVLRSILLISCVTVFTGACGGSSAPTTPGTTAGPGSDAALVPLVDELMPALDLKSLQVHARVVMVARQLLELGFQCGWHAGWMRTIKDARKNEPSAFRSDALGGAFGFGFVMLIAGATATMFLAWLLPRLSRRRARAEAPATTTPAAPIGWSSYFKELGVRFLQRLGRALHVELFDPVLASQRTQTIHIARDAERQLAVAIDAANRLAPTEPPTDAPSAEPSVIPVVNDAPSAPSPSRDVRAVLETWRAEIQTLRKKLEAPGALPRELSADVVLPRIENIARMARDTRVGFERAAIALAGQPQTTLDDGAWIVWGQRLAERPKTPHEQSASHAALLPWVRPLGLGGLGAVALGIVLIAMWMAAGAFPLFFAFLVAAGGLGAVTVARVHLHRAGRLTLLPGFADRVARWLTTVCALAFAAMLLSSWLSAESGLDLGDPPPVPVPDPAALKAPDLWPAATKP